MAWSIPLWMLAILVSAIDQSRSLAQESTGPAQSSYWSGQWQHTQDVHQAALGSEPTQTTSDETAESQSEPNEESVQPSPNARTFQIRIADQTGASKASGDSQPTQASNVEGQPQDNPLDVPAPPQIGNSQLNIATSDGKYSSNNQPMPLAINPPASLPPAGDLYRKHLGEQASEDVPQNSFVPPIRHPNEMTNQKNQLAAQPSATIPESQFAARRTSGPTQEPEEKPVAPPVVENLPIPQDQATVPPIPEDVKLGEEPEEPVPFFLRQESVLLDPGELQVDFTLLYLNDTSDGFLATVINNNLIIGEVERTQRLLLTPIEFRLGIRGDAQMFLNIPVGWSNSEVLFGGEDNFANTGGIGDISIGCTKQRIQGSNGSPDFLTTFGMTIPSGDSNLFSSFETPGSQLGTGHWALFSAATWIKNHDPVAFFYGFGSVYRFEHSFESGITVEPGLELIYRMGVGFAVNSNVTFSTTFQGSYIFDTTVEDVRIAGSYLEPMSIRLASTIARKPDKDCRKGCGCIRCRSRAKLVEPFVNFGITEDANDAVFGISWTY
jgi:hypothetical protein